MSEHLEDFVSRIASAKTQEPTEPLPVPDGLDQRGAKLWTETTSEFSFNSAELQLLFETCQILDELEQFKRFQQDQEYTTKGSRNQDVIAPMLSHIDKVRATLASNIKSLGLTGTENLSVTVNGAVVDSRTLSQKRAEAGRKGAKTRWGTCR